MFSSNKILMLILVLLCSLLILLLLYTVERVGWEQPGVPRATRVPGERKPDAGHGFDIRSFPRNVAPRRPIAPCSSEPPARPDLGARGARIRLPPWEGRGRREDKGVEGWPPQIRGRSREELAWKEREGEEEGEERRGREDPATAMARSLGREKTGVCIALL